MITPAVGETPAGVKTTAFGVLKFARLGTLNRSARNCSFSFSCSRVSLRNDKSARFPSVSVATATLMYTFMNLGAFLVVVALRRAAFIGEDLEDIS